MMNTTASVFQLLAASLLAAFILPANKSQAQSPADAVTLPEMTVTSFKGKFELWNTGGTEGHFADLTPPAAGQSAPPVHVSPGHRLRPVWVLNKKLMASFSDAGPDGIQQAVVALPGVGGCFLLEGSLGLPGPNPSQEEEGMTVTCDNHIGAIGRAFFNIDPVQMASKGGKVFRLKNEFRPNGNANAPKAVVSTKGGRFFLFDGESGTDSGGTTMYFCMVGVTDGSVSVQELGTQKQVEVKAGNVVLISSVGIAPARALTKAEQSFDIACKLAVLGREVPARLPATMKTVASTSLPGTKVNSLGMVFVPLPGTKILMCVHETRWQDFAPYVAAMPSLPDRMRRGSANGFWGWDDHPVSTNWDEAQGFCSWLSQKEGKKYRLPTDEEWSLAVGIGNREKRASATTPAMLSKDNLQIYPWGPAWPPPAGSANIFDLSGRVFLNYGNLKPVSAQEYDDGFALTAPVMSFKPNKLGIYDLSGNLAEWCADWFDDTHTKRVTRGGSYRDFSQETLVSSNRYPRNPDDLVGRFTGFRIVMEAP